jgi:hypothetical protein
LRLYNADDFDCKNECAERDVLLELRRRLGIDGYKPPAATPPPSSNGESPRLSGPLTVTEYAAVKKLNEEWLRNTWDLFDTAYTGVPAVGFPYDNDRKLVKFRGTGECDKLWPAGVNTTLYGLPFLRSRFLALAHFGGYEAVPPYLFIVEGESDTQTMMQIPGFPTLGVSGQGVWKPEWSKMPLINESQLIFNIQEPDDARLPREQWTWVKADKWTKKIAESLPDIQVRAVRLPAKDASALWLDMHEMHGWAGEEAVKEAFEDAVRAASTRESSILVSQPLKPDEPSPSFEMPETVLCGRLGELVTKNLTKLPRAYAWLSLVAVAGILVPPGDESTSLFVANVGPSGSGKGVSIEHSLKLLGLQIGEPKERPLVFTDQAGSFEGLARHSIGDRNGEQCLWYQSELAITLGKSRIEGATFSPALCDLYDHHSCALVIKKERVSFDARLTIAGGLVDSNFADVFTGITSFGFYQRFLFALHQETGALDPEYTGQLITRPELAPVTVTGSAREAMRAFNQEHKDAGRILQNILRVAIICAAWDGKANLTGDDMAPHLALADYQTKVRLVLRPDLGRNQMAQACNRIMAYLERHGGDVLVTKMNKDTNVSKEFSPGMQHQAINQLVAAGEVEIVTPRPLTIRKVPSVTVKLET